jgi:uncharacterized protein
MPSHEQTKTAIRTASVSTVLPTDRTAHPHRTGHGATAVLLMLIGIVCAIAWRDTNIPRLHDVTIAVPGLAHQIDVLQVTDLGGQRFGQGQSRLAMLIAGKHYDTIVLTGDMAEDLTFDPVWELTDVLRPHSSRIWYLRGNHDFSSLGVEMAQHGVPSLPATGAVALAAWDPQAVDVALVYGQDTPSISAAKGKGRRLALVASHTPPSESRLVAGQTIGPGLHFFIAGHTHGGQIRLPFVGALGAPLSWPGEERLPALRNEITFLPELQQPQRYVDGMYDRGNQRIFVARGLDCNTGKFRFACQAEIVAYHFVPAATR